MKSGNAKAFRRVRSKVHGHDITPSKIRAWRKAHGWSQVEAGKKMGVSWMSILRWENGSQKPTGIYLSVLRTFMKKWLDKRTNGR